MVTLPFLTFFLAPSENNLEEIYSTCNKLFWSWYLKLLITLLFQYSTCSPLQILIVHILNNKQKSTLQKWKYIIWIIHSSVKSWNYSKRRPTFGWFPYFKSLLHCHDHNSTFFQSFEQNFQMFSWPDATSTCHIHYTI